jgi:hypothetical protein
MGFTTESPRFSLRAADFSRVRSALQEVGHVVLEEVWNDRFLVDLRRLAEEKFVADDKLYNGKLDQYPKDVVMTYLGGATELFSLFKSQDEGWRKDRDFFSEVSRSGLPALFQYLCLGDFVVGRAERVIRRTDPKFPMRFTGLHYDFQCEEIAKHGMRSNSAFTVWTPLQDCSRDDTPRLLLLKLGERVDDATSPALKLGAYATHSLNSPAIDTLFEQIYASNSCYAPYIPLGSVILFDYRVVHASYRTEKMHVPRYSLDFRVVGEYIPGSATSSFNGRIYRENEFPKPKMTLLSRVKHEIRRHFC